MLTDYHGRYTQQSIGYSDCTGERWCGLHGDPDSEGEINDVENMQTYLLEGKLYDLETLYYA
jgi:hypothetical protein